MIKTPILFASEQRATRYDKGARFETRFKTAAEIGK